MVAQLAQAPNINCEHPGQKKKKKSMSLPPLPLTSPVQHW